MEKKIKFEDVMRVYSGRTGCMCGCRGIYRWSSTVSQEEANKERGYEVKPKEWNDTHVRMVIAILNDSPHTKEDDGVFFLESVDDKGNERTYAAYLKE